MRQNINIVIINIIRERARFFDVYKNIFISIDSIIISISIFVVKCLDHELLLEKFFQRVVHRNSINMNNKSLEMILYSLNKKKRMNFLKVFIEYIIKKKEKSVFTMKSLNV